MSKRHGFTGVGLLALGLMACGQGLNWREVRFESTAARVMLPCKPELAQRKVALGSDEVLLSMQGCEIQGLQFTWSHLPLPATGQANRVLSVWQQASLKSLGAHADALGALTAFPLKGAGADKLAVQVAATAAGRQAHFYWWVQDQQAHQLAVYAQGSDIPKAVLQNLEEGIALP
jgi:hypothetical protein